MRREIHGIAGLRELIGKTLGPGPSITIDQQMIDLFARATDDHQWIHTDVERARVENGSTIAHGMLTLSMIVPMANAIFAVVEPMAINYGFEKVRFLAPIPAGAAVEATFRFEGVVPSAQGTKVLCSVTISIAEEETVACAAQWWTFYPTLTI